MKPILKRVVLVAAFVVAADIATMAFAGPAIEKMETDGLAREDAAYIQSHPEEIKNGTGYGPEAVKKGQVVVVSSRCFIPFVVTTNLRIVRGGRAFPVVGGKYLWLPFHTSRLSPNPWECQGMFHSK